jgi:hypothetical protein
MRIISKLKNYKYEVECFFFPRHQTVRKSIPRTWVDSDHLIEQTNFAIIKEFVEEELDGLEDVIKQHFWNLENGYTEWAQFYSWLEKAYRYITIDRPDWEEKLDESYPPLDDENPLGQINCSKETHEQRYGLVIYWEDRIKKMDTEILKEMIENRGGFWT